LEKRANTFIIKEIEELKMYKEVLTNQYKKCFEILCSVIKGYPEDLWKNDIDYKYPVWQIVYHALFYTNIYCSPSEDNIIPWSKEIDDYQIFGKAPWPPYNEIVITRSYSKNDMLEFLKFIEENLKDYLLEMKPEEDCWPHWYNENQLEFHINNIRHIQHHTAEIIERADIIETFKYTWL